MAIFMGVRQGAGHLGLHVDFWACLDHCFNILSCHPTSIRMGLSNFMCKIQICKR